MCYKHSWFTPVQGIYIARITTFYSQKIYGGCYFEKGHKLTTRNMDAVSMSISTVAS